MANYEIKTFNKKHGIKFKIDGEFDGATAWDIRNILSDKFQDHQMRYTFDFSKVRKFYPFGVMVFTQGLKAIDPTLSRFKFMGNKAPIFK